MCVFPRGSRSKEKTSSSSRERKSTDRSPRQHHLGSGSVSKHGGASASLVRAANNGVLVSIGKSGSSHNIASLVDELDVEDEDADSDVDADVAPLAHATPNLRPSENPLLAGAALEEESPRNTLSPPTRRNK